MAPTLWMPFDSSVKVVYASLNVTRYPVPRTLYLVPQENEHIQVQTLLAIVDGCMRTTTVYRHIMTVRTVAVD